MFEEVKIKFRLLLLILTLSTIFVNCGTQSGGLAPSKYDDIPSTESSIKYGESLVSANGWEISIDTTDPVEGVALANGWSVEVKHE